MRKQRKLLSLLLVCVMLCLPVLQAGAAVSYDVSAGLESRILFPGDSLAGISTAVIQDGTEVNADGGVWTNSDTSPAAYRAYTAEDGSIQLETAGYVLTVVNGTSVTDDEGGTSENHYTYSDEEKAAQEAEGVKKDTAFYQYGENVRITANSPQEGYQFAGWTVETEGSVSLGDSAASETTFAMTDKKVTITASYQEIPQTEPVTEAPVTEAPVTEAPVTETPVTEASAAETPAADTSAGETSVSDGESLVIGDDTGVSENGAENDLVVIGDAPASEYTVTVNNGEGSGSYPAGDWVTIKAEDRTAEGQQFTGWFADSMNASLEDPSLETTGFVMPEADVSVTATYTEMQQTARYQVTVNNGEGSGNYESGAAVTVTAADYSAEGMVFAGWFVESGDVVIENIMDTVAEFVMPESSVVISATYQEDTTAAETTAPAETEASDEPGASDLAVIDIEDTESGTDASETEAQTNAAEAGTAETAPTEAGSAETETEAPEQTTAAESGETEPADVDVEITDNTEAQSETPEQTEQPEQTYTVTIENGVGAGTYQAGETVYIEANAAAQGQQFSAWEIVSGSITLSDAAASVTSFVMPESDVALRAVYTTATHTVTLVNAKDGAGQTNAEYAENTEVSILADAAPDGMEFDHWEGTVATASGTASLTFKDASASATSFVMPAGDVTVHAIYTELPETYVVTVSNGLINDSATSLVCEEGTTITVSANPSPYGQRFASWTVNNGAYDLGDEAYNERITVTVTENLTFLAQYEGIQYQVTVNNGISNYDSCVAGTVVTIAANEAPTGMAFDYWVVDSQNASLADANSATTTFTMPEGNVTVTAVYKEVLYTVTVQNGSADQEYYSAGDTVTISSSYPASGREFDVWNAVSGNVTFADASRWTTTFTMPDSDVTVAATYKDGPSSSQNGISGLSEGGEYYTNEKLTFSPVGAGMSNTNPNPGDYRYRPTGYQIGNVSNSFSNSSYETSMSIRSAGEYTLKVNFVREVYNGSSWQSDGTTDVKSVTFRVITQAAGVATGDETPLALIVTVAAVSCVVFVILLVVVIRRRTRR